MPMSILADRYNGSGCCFCRSLDKIKTVLDVVSQRYTISVSGKGFEPGAFALSVSKY